MNITRFLRTPTLENICERLLLQQNRQKNHDLYITFPCIWNIATKDIMIHFNIPIAHNIPRKQLIFLLQVFIQVAQKKNGIVK